MGAVEIIQDITKDLTTVTVRDKFSTEAIMDSIADYYSGSVTSLLLLDCREADLKKITTQELRKIAGSVSKLSVSRKRGKTALVFSQELMFGLGRMYEIYTELAGVHVRYKSFRDIEEAKDWLMTANTTIR